MDVVGFDCQPAAEIVAEPPTVLCRERHLEVRIQAVHHLGNRRGERHIGKERIVSCEKRAQRGRTAGRVRWIVERICERIVRVELRESVRQQRVDDVDGVEIVMVLIVEDAATPTNRRASGARGRPDDTDPWREIVVIDRRLLQQRRAAIALGRSAHSWRPRNHCPP